MFSHLLWLKQMRIFLCLNKTPSFTKQTFERLGQMVDFES